MLSFTGSAAVGVRLGATGAFCGNDLRLSSVPVKGATVMIAERSPSVPFLPHPKHLTADMPGYAGFDPLGISDKIDIKWLQEAEIKHGRVCMLAFLGIIIQEFFHIPGAEFQNPVATEAFYQVPAAGIWQIIAFCGILEYILHKGKLNSIEMFEDPETKPGHLGFNPLRLKITPAVQTQEIKNGRLAMVGVGGVLHSMFVFKTPIIAQLMDFQPMSGF